MKIERGCTMSQTVDNSLLKRLWTCRKKDKRDKAFILRCKTNFGLIYSQDLLGKGKGVP
jgi:hypothetical protein